MNKNIVEIEQNIIKKIKSVQKFMELLTIDFTTTILHGEPGATIVEYVNTSNFDVVILGSRGLNNLQSMILGSRGLNNLQSMILGSVSHKVAKRVECPVLIIK